MCRRHQPVADFDLDGCLRHFTRYPARQSRALWVNLLLHINAEETDERRARKPPFREENDWQSREVVAAAVRRRSRLPRRHEVSRLV